VKKYKICPVCGEKNEDSEVLCVNCVTDISNVALKTECDPEQDCREIKSQLSNDGAKTKTCPECGAVNPDYAVLCDNCQTGIADVRADESFKNGAVCKNANNEITGGAKTEYSEENISQLVLYSKNTGTGIKITVKSGDIIGRCAKCMNPPAEYSNCSNKNNNADRDFIDCVKFDTVSRRHAQFVYENGTFFIIALLESKNSTYLNGEIIERGRKYAVNDGDVIKFSSRLELNVKY